jgi:signal transduction histidine kinase/HAMP domain-containing protein
MFLASLPWMLAAGFLGPAPATVLAGLTGIFLGYWDTHSPFTMLEYGLAGVIFSTAIHQRYRTLIFRLLSRPIIAAGLISILYPLFYVLSDVFLIGGSLSTRLDFALSRLLSDSIAFIVPLLLGAIVCELLAFIFSTVWYGSDELIPSPAEYSLQSRLTYLITPIFFALLSLLTIGDLYVATEVASQNLQLQLQTTAETSAESIPYFLETGQNLIMRMATNPALYQSTPDELVQVLSAELRAIPYFHQLYLLDTQENPIAGYPNQDYHTLPPTPEEKIGIQQAIYGVGFQFYSVPPTEIEAQTAEISFIAAVQDGSGETQAVLLGRTQLETNPYFQPILKGLNSIYEVGGEGLLLDDQHIILYSTTPRKIFQTYPVETDSIDPIFYDGPGPDGTRRFIYYYPLAGSPWIIVTSIPARLAQQTALNFVLPRLVMLAALAIVGFALLRVTLGVVTQSLQKLATQASRIADNELEHPLAIQGDDEVGRLGIAFERMRLSLKARLEELNRLLFVSRGIASSLDMETAITPILEAALATGASTAHLVLSPAATSGLEESAPTQFGLGASAERYSDLNQQVMQLVEEHESILLKNPLRAGLTMSDGTPPPQAINAIALSHENTFYGALWVAYDEPHQFSEEETRFLDTISVQAALAIANTHLYLAAEAGQQRLAAILTSTHDPILVTNRQNQLLLANPASCNLLADGDVPPIGEPIDNFVQNKEILELLHVTSDTVDFAEISLPNDKVYYATASPVVIDRQQMGRVCVMRDVTEFKKLDALKSEFVNTVSHDLRSPLTLVRGYATMLEMVGDMNEQQLNYVRKIVVGVESMSRLVNNLLDLGRMEAGVGLRLEMVPIVDLVGQIVETLQIQALHKKLSLTFSAPKDTKPVVEADVALLQQAIHNLIENAIKYTDEGTIQVSLELDEESILILVKDTGIGIAPVDQPRLFEKFYRVVSRTTQKQRGSGLGLAIVKTIATLHRGKVWLESQLGKGSTFYLQIPLRQPKTDEGTTHE